MIAKSGAGVGVNLEFVRRFGVLKNKNSPDFNSSQKLWRIYIPESALITLQETQHMLQGRKYWSQNLTDISLDYT